MSCDIQLSTSDTFRCAFPSLARSSRDLHNFYVSYALFPALNRLNTNYVCSSAVLQLHFPRLIQYTRFPAIHTIDTFHALSKSKNLDCSVPFSLENLSKEEYTQAKGQQYSKTTYLVFFQVH